MRRIIRRGIGGSDGEEQPWGCSLVCFERWKWELKQLAWEIVIWQGLPILDDLAKHRLNRTILYSAIILRKIIEDEEEVETIAKEGDIPLPEQKNIHASLEVIKYPYIGEEGWALRSKFFSSDYGKGRLFV